MLNLLGNCSKHRIPCRVLATRNCIADYCRRFAELHGHVDKTSSLEHLAPSASPKNTQNSKAPILTPKFKRTGEPTKTKTHYGLGFRVLGFRV